MTEFTSKMIDGENYALFAVNFNIETEGTQYVRTEKSLLDAFSAVGGINISINTTFEVIVNFLCAGSFLIK